jgi:NitT/TauT family transport system permease protein
VATETKNRLSDQALGAAARGARSEAWQTALWALASIGLLLLFWYAASLIADDPRRLPTPFQVLARIAEETAKGDLPYHLGVTLLRVAASFAVAMVIGTALGFAMGRLALLDRVGHAWLVFFLNMPALVIIVLCYIWIGLTETAVVIAVSLNKIPNVVVTVREGARTLDKGLLEMAESFRIGRLKTLTKIVLVTELLGRSNGVGYKIFEFFSNFDVDKILAYSLAFTVVILMIEWTLMMPLERHVTRWRR